MDIVEVIQRTAHDFKNPLSIVMGCGDLIAWMADDAGQHKIKELADDVVNAATRLKGFTDTMVAMTRLEHGDQPQPRLIAAHAALRNAVTELTRLATRARVQLAVDAPTQLELHVDPDWLSRVLFNLLDHAIRYAPSGTTVRLSASAGEGRTRLTITDDGPRVTDKPALFTVLKGKSQERQGSGLSLPYCARAVAAMHGTIGVDDVTAESGACFWLDLPSQP
jgi:two-component system sensor histidine kinase KdpD